LHRDDIILAVIGKKLAQYEIRAELGRGGMGVVYAAHDSRLRRDVAIKLLSKDAAGQGEDRDRLLAEARAAAALNHPGICTIHEVGDDDSCAFIVMERLTGRTLREIISEGPADARTLASVAAQAAEALAAAHAQGIVHSDVKPANIMILPGDRVKLLDFGVALRMDHEALTVSRIAPEMGGGTPAYMAPEQVQGGRATPACDLFSLGMVLYEWAAGARPSVKPDPPKDLPAELARITLRLLERNPENRYRSALELQADLSAFIRASAAPVSVSAVVAGKPSLAVLPFRVLSQDSADEYHGVAIADGIINGVSDGGRVVVRPIGMMMRYARRDVEPVVVGRELGVATIVEGSVQRQGTQLRVHAHAWNAADGTSLWSARYETAIADMFAVQDRISADVLKALGVAEPNAPDLEVERPTENAAALDLYLRANERMSRMNQWDWQTAVEMLERAVKLDPHFVEAWSALSEACVWLFNFEQGIKWVERGEQAVKRALALDPNNARTLVAKGRLLFSPRRKFQSAAAMRLAMLATRLKPGLYQAKTLAGAVMVHIGLHEDSLDALSSVIASNPRDSQALVTIGNACLYMGDFERADHFISQAVQIDPQSVWSNVFRPCVSLYAGRLDEAQNRIAESAAVLPGDPWLTACEALLWAKRGEHKKSEKLVALALKPHRTVLHTHHLWHYAAAASAMNGNYPQAVRLLKRAASTGLDNYPAFRDDAHLRPLAGYQPNATFMTGLKKKWEAYRREFGKTTTAR
jgi:TolB-like protein/Tfp pilus assembly protein PilF/predicted Ser/Thr protein kinase